MRCSRGDGGFRVADGMFGVGLSSFGYEKEEKNGGGESALAREVHRPQLLQLMAPAAFTPQKIARCSPLLAFPLTPSPATVVASEDFGSIAVHSRDMKQAVPPRPMQTRRLCSEKSRGEAGHVCIRKISSLRLGHTTCSRDKISCLLHSVGGQKRVYACMLYANLGASS